MSKTLEEMLALQSGTPANIPDLNTVGAAAQLTRRMGQSDIAPIRRNLLEQAYAQFGNLVGKGAAAVRPAPNQEYGLGFAEAARYGVNQGREFVADWWDRAASGFEDSSNKLPMVRMENGLMSMQADPRILDMFDTATLGAMGVSRVARGAIMGTEQALREFLEAGVRSGGQIAAGGRAKTADLAAREKAMALYERMPESKAKRDLVYRETGWWKGKDNQWRFELSDEEAKLNPALLQTGTWNGALSEVLDHPKLFEAYPHLRGTRVELKIDPNAPRGGHFDGANNVIVMTAPDAEGMRKGLIHEAGHGVQYDEGFAPGGTPESAQERIRRTLENDPYLDPKDQLTLDQAGKLAALHSDPVSAYRHLAGEAEARVAERRINMTDEERRARGLWNDFDIPEQDQLVLTGMRDKPVSMIYSGGEGGPKDAVTGYKLLRADEARKGELFPLFVDSDTPVPMQDWVQAKDAPHFIWSKNGRPYVPAKTGGSMKLAPEEARELHRRGLLGKPTNTTVKGVAYRPGWHAGDAPFSHHLGINPQIDPVTGKKVLTERAPDQIWTEVSMPNDVDWQSIALSRALPLKKGGIDVGTAQITDQVPYGGHYRYKTNPNMVGDWMISGDMRINRVLTDEEVAQLNLNAGYRDLPRTEPLDLARFGLEDAARSNRTYSFGSGAPESSSNPLTRVNIGLMKGRTGEMYSADEALAALRDLGVEPRSYGVAGSRTEPTLVAELPRPVTASEMDTLASRLDQEAIAQKVGDAGELYGPKAAEWGPFNDDFFLDLNRIRRPSRDEISQRTRSEPDIAKSIFSAANSNPAAKAEPVTEFELDTALANRARYRAEPAATPGPNAPPKAWVSWGKKHGVDLRVSPAKEIAPGVSIPGGLDGKFTIADLFELKSLKIDPNTLPREVHDALMQKLVRTYDIKNPDPVDVFNRLAFAQLSPNAPLLQNEFLMQRLRATSMQDIERLASREGQEDLARALDAESGVGAASRGGMGVKGTADLSNLATLARAVLEKPEMFRARPGETLRDVGLRVMNQIPGLGPKTVSLGVPWLDLPHANTSAVDLHMIRNNYERLLSDRRVGTDFVQRMSAKLGTENNLRAVRAAMRRDPDAAEQAAIEIIGGSSRSKVYRSARTGEVNAEMPDSLQPDLLWREPEKATFFNEFYDRIVDFVNESRGADPKLALFPEQWRLWDGYRGRVEPHEFAHPDWRKLPKQSFSEMQAALKANRDAGFGDSAPKQRERVDWRKLYYGNANTDLLAMLAAGGGAAALSPLLLDDED